ncbi:hypothetical protein BDF21DRAFT_330193, partial [Thamnidium elegans]
FAKQVATNETKYYNNKDKVVLADKRLQPQDMQNMYKPVLQIMGTSCHIYILSLVDKCFYLFQQVYSMSYTVINHDIKSNSIQEIVFGLVLV